MTAYQSPYGRPSGLRERLAAHRNNLSSTRYPWQGTGIIADLELLMQILDKREWLQAMLRSDDPDAQRFAAELLDDDETNEAMQLAAEQVATKVDANSTAAPPLYRRASYDPVATIEQLDEAAQEAQRQVRAIRDVMQRAGAIDDETSDDDLPVFLQVLLS